MFQYEFFTHRKYRSLRTSQSRQPILMPPCFIKMEDIQWVRASYWKEQCRKSRKPEYCKHCTDYQLRQDGRCRASCYGIYDNPRFPDSFYHAQLRFQPWCQLETIVCPGSLSPQQTRKFHQEGIRKASQCAALSPLKSLGYPTAAQGTFRRFGEQQRQFWETAGSYQDCFDFLLQLFSHEAESCSLVFEIVQEDRVVFRECVDIFPGYNQRYIVLKDLFPAQGTLQARFYPEADRALCLVFLFCEFVQLKPGIYPLTYPFSPSLDTPDEKVRCVAWSLNQILWEGTLGDTGSAIPKLRPGVRETMEELDRRGIVQAALCKCTPETLIPILERLGIRHFFPHVFANWNSNLRNLQETGGLLSTPMDTIALMEADPFGRADVAHNLPMVRIFDANAAAIDSPECILHRPEFDQPVTQHSQLRRHRFQEDLLRRQAMEAFQGSHLEFLRSCGISVTLSPVSTEEELHRTQALLSNGNILCMPHRDPLEVPLSEHIYSSSRDCLAVYCTDCFGSFGQIGYVETSTSGNILLISALAFSAQAADMHIEPALLSALYYHYADPAIAKLRLVSRVTGSNGTFLWSLQSLGFRCYVTDPELHLMLEIPIGYLNDPHGAEVAIYPENEQCGLK